MGWPYYSSNSDRVIQDSVSDYLVRLGWFILHFRSQISFADVFRIDIAAEKKAMFLPLILIHMTNLSIASCIFCLPVKKESSEKGKKQNLLSMNIWIQLHYVHKGPCLYKCQYFRNIINQFWDCLQFWIETWKIPNKPQNKQDWMGKILEPNKGK